MLHLSTVNETSLGYTVIISLLYFSSFTVHVEAFPEESIVVKLRLEFGGPQWKIYHNLSISDWDNHTDLCKPIMTMLDTSQLFFPEKIHFCRVIQRGMEGFLVWAQLHLYLKNPTFGLHTLHAWKDFANQDLPAIVEWWWKRNIPTSINLFGMKVEEVIREAAHVFELRANFELPHDEDKSKPGALKQGIRDEVQRIFGRSSLSEALFDVTVNTGQFQWRKLRAILYFNFRLTSNKMLFTSGRLAVDYISQIIQEHYTPDSNSIIDKSSVKITEQDGSMEDVTEVVLYCKKPSEVVSLSVLYYGEIILDGQILRQKPNMSEDALVSQLAEHMVHKANKQLGRRLLNAVGLANLETVHDVVTGSIVFFVDVRTLIKSASPKDVDNLYELLNYMLRSVRWTTGAKLLRQPVPLPVTCHKTCEYDKRNAAATGSDGSIFGKIFPSILILLQTMIL